MVDAFSEGQRRLVVVGDGPEKDALVTRAGRNVVFLSDLTDAQLRWLYRRTRGLISASFEDFGLTPLEAAAFGRPSVVPREGGFLDTVIDGKTGVLYDDVTPEGLQAALSVLDEHSWNAQFIRQHALGFSEASFIARLREAVGRIASNPVAG